ncbi:hypothetical protein CBR_g293 [Chara braunii]|uniref:DUF659 domain-containing protein n=1 Tax=Chara braunii TaxID=69332 RepID=A0A388JQC3_CHABU|nr:hypothetical protein CBR_g293 [Chara braunii]|eukprot:GBG59963.1 hypothetical protein CBR_g293 [Chara braunii]
MVRPCESSSNAGKEKVKAGAPKDKPPFEAQPNEKHQALLKENIMYKWIVQGQAAEPKGYDLYWVRWKLYNQQFTTSSTGAMEHFLRKGKPCPYRNGEILHLMALRGGKIEGEAAKKMLHEYRAQKGIAEDTGMEPTAAWPRGKSDEMEEHLKPLPLVEGQTAAGMTVDDTQDKTVPPTVGPSFQASTSGSMSTRTTQISIRKWAENTTQKRSDTHWGRALFRSGVPFNFVRQDETRALHKLYMELGATKAKVDMPKFETVRTAILDLVYDQVKQEVRPVMDKWDISGCTLIAADTTDRRRRPVINFIGAGEGGAVLIKVIDMSHRKTNAAAIAQLWEEVIREIGVHRLNAICTDNAQVNKRAARILSLHKDPDIARIPWVPCAAHTLSLLLKGIAKLPWVAKIVKRAKLMVKLLIKRRGAHLEWEEEGTTVAMDREDDEVDEVDEEVYGDVDDDDDPDYAFCSRGSGLSMAPPVDRIVGREEKQQQKEQQQQGQQQHEQHEDQQRHEEQHEEHQQQQQKQQEEEQQQQENQQLEAQQRQQQQQQEDKQYQVEQQRQEPQQQDEREQQQQRQDDREQQQDDRGQQQQDKQQQEQQQEDQQKQQEQQQQLKLQQLQQPLQQQPQDINHKTSCINRSSSTPRVVLLHFPTWTRGSSMTTWRSAGQGGRGRPTSNLLLIHR